MDHTIGRCCRDRLDKGETRRRRTSRRSSRRRSRRRKRRKVNKWKKKNNIPFGKQLYSPLPEKFGDEGKGKQESAELQQIKFPETLGGVARQHEEPGLQVSNAAHVARSPPVQQVERADGGV